MGSLSVSIVHDEWALMRCLNGNKPLVSENKASMAYLGKMKASAAGESICTIKKLVAH